MNLRAIAAAGSIAAFGVFTMTSGTVGQMQSFKQQLVALHGDFDGLGGAAIRLVPARTGDQRGPRCCEVPLAALR
jgi:hypothetical protein